MIELSWHDEEIPKKLKIKQIYAVMFTTDGRVMLQSKIRNGKTFYSLSGGSPEIFDKDIYATLKRELIEEVNTTIEDDIVYLGYQKVNENNGKPEYAQVRTLAIIKKIGKSQPDPATGETYNRILTTPEKAIKLLNWGEIGEIIIKKATQIFLKKFKGIKISTEEQTV